MVDFRKVQKAEDFDCQQIYRFDSDNDLTIRGIAGSIQCLADTIPYMPNYFMLQGSAFQEADIAVQGYRREQLRMRLPGKATLHFLRRSVYSTYIITELTGSTAMVVDEAAFTTDPAAFMTPRLLDIAEEVGGQKLAAVGLGYLSAFLDRSDG